MFLIWEIERLCVSEMDNLLLGSISVHIVSTVIGSIANSLLLFLVLMRTPKWLTTYSILIFNTTITDLLMCISFLAVLQR